MLAVVSVLCHSHIHNVRQGDMVAGTRSMSQSARTHMCTVEPSMAPPPVSDGRFQNSVALNGEIIFSSRMLGADGTSASTVVT